MNAPPKRRDDRWHPDRIFWLGYLSGRGRTLDQIAKNPLVQSTASALQRLFLRRNWPVNDNRKHGTFLLLSQGAIKEFMIAGKSRDLPLEQVIELYVERGVSIIDAVIDDKAARDSETG